MKPINNEAVVAIRQCMARRIHAAIRPDTPGVTAERSEATIQSLVSVAVACYMTANKIPFEPQVIEKFANTVRDSMDGFASTLRN